MKRMVLVCVGLGLVAALALPCAAAPAKKAKSKKETTTQVVTTTEAPTTTQAPTTVATVAANATPLVSALDASNAVVRFFSTPDGEALLRIGLPVASAVLSLWACLFALVAFVKVRRNIPRRKKDSAGDYSHYF